MSDKLNKYFDEADQYVDDLKNKPELRMLDILIGDQVFFLKPDSEGGVDENGVPLLYNCGGAVVSSISNLDGQHKEMLPINKVSKVYLKSDSYPFELNVDVEHILRNYTAEERK